ncbi:hypothetical protein A2U01_0112529, partial [Trifolium medium]|nr:hypothetical protein [Trifolium medium]
ATAVAGAGAAAAVGYSEVPGEMRVKKKKM